MAWQDDYRRSEVPGGVVLTVPPTVVPASDRIGIVLPNRPRWIKVHNSGDVDLRLAYSEAALDASPAVYWPVESGAVDTDSATEAVRTLWIENPDGATAGEVTLKICVGREAFEDSHPELTVANGFPEFDPSDTDAIVPGVG